MSLEIGIRDIQGVSVVDVRGRITLGGGAGELREALRIMTREGHRKILLNLADVTYMDSSGLGVLVAAFATVTNQGGQVKLLHLTQRIMDLLLITKLLTVFEVFDDEAAACRSFLQTAVAR